MTELRLGFDGADLAPSRTAARSCNRAGRLRVRSDDADGAAANENGAREDHWTTDAGRRERDTDAR